MIRRTAGLVLLYLVGLLLVWGWSLSHLLGGTATRDNLALVLVLPLAWTSSYWPMVGSLLAAWKIWRLQKTLETWAERKALGLQAELPEREIEDVLTRLAAEENGIPEKWARRLVRKLMDAIRERIATEGAPSALDAGAPAVPPPKPVRRSRCPGPLPLWAAGAGACGPRRRLRRRRSRR